MTDRPPHQLLALWCVPRSRSTVFLRTMAERGDLTVVHEPFSRTSFFGAVDIGGASCRSEHEVIRALLALADSGPVFFKDTTDFRYPGVLSDSEFLRAATHGVLVRRPEAVVSSYLRLHPDARRAEMGFENLVELRDVVRAETGQQPIVLDGDELAADPASTVAAYCEHVGIPFREDALRWEVGGLPDWEQFARWHVKAAATTGFVKTEPQPLPEELKARATAYVAHHRAYYERLVDGR